MFHLTCEIYNYRINVYHWMVAPLGKGYEQQKPRDLAPEETSIGVKVWTTDSSWARTRAATLAVRNELTIAFYRRHHKFIELAW